MRGKHFTLISTMLRASGGQNIIKYSGDKKKRNQVSYNRWGFGILYFMLFAYCALMSIGYGLVGLYDVIPVIAVLSITLIALFFTFIKTNGYLFAFKEYDMIMAMPFKPREILMDKFIFMYVKSIPFMAIISLSMLIGYAAFARPGIVAVLLWILLTPFVPVFPMLVAALLGAVIIAIGNCFKYKKIAQILLTFVIIIPISLSGSLIGQLVDEMGVDEVLTRFSEVLDKICRYYPPAVWFQRSVTSGNFLYFLLFVIANLAAFEVFSLVIGRFYRNINSRLLQSARGKKYKLVHQKKKSPVKAIAFKEFKRMIGSTVYATNCGMGQIMCLLLGIVAIFVSGDKLISIITEGEATSGGSFVAPLIVPVLYFLIGMMPTTVCSLSLEGKNLWIVQSMPIDKLTLYKGKMLFCLFMDIPFMLFPILTLGISFKVSFLEILFLMLEGTIMCLFSTVYGMVCGIKFARFDWDNEVEVVKQGTGLLVYMFPNMIGTMIIGGASVGLAFILPTWVIAVCAAGVYGILSLVMWKVIVKCSNK